MQVRRLWYEAELTLSLRAIWYNNMQMMRVPINRESNYIKHLIEHLDAEFNFSILHGPNGKYKVKIQTQFPWLRFANTISNFLIRTME